MTTVNSVSGGKTSCYMAIHHPADVNIFACVCIDDPKCAPKDPALLAYCLEKLNGNFVASAEHDKTLRVMMQLEQILGREIVWVRGKSFDEVIAGAGCLPTWARRFCTTDMKIYPMFEYLYPRYGTVEKRIGFRADELERIKSSSSNSRPTKFPYCQNTYGKRLQKWIEVENEVLSFPLSRTFQYQIIDFWKNEHPEFEFPKDSNCRGCHHKPPELLQKNWQETPEHLEWFARQEKVKLSKNPQATTGFYTWKPATVGTYEEIFKMHFTEEINFENFTMCNSGGCTD